MIALNPNTNPADLARPEQDADRAANARVTPESLLAGLNWRYATKQYDSSRKLDDATWNALRQALVLAPSSVGLQPWKFIVVEDKAVRARLREAAWGQSPVTDADKFVVFAARAGFDESDVDRFMARTAQVRGVTVESLDGFRQMAMSVVARPEAERDTWASRQAYIALGTLVTAAAVLGVDTTPMEGFNPAAFDEILGLKEKGYRSYAAAAVGYRAQEDKYATLPKVRFAQEDVVEYV